MKIKVKETMNKIHKVTLSTLLAIALLIPSIPCKAALAGQADAATEVQLLFPKVPRFYIGFNFKGYQFPEQSNGRKYNKSTILKRTIFQGSPVAFEVPANSSTSAFIEAASPFTSADINVGVIDSTGNEFIVDAEVIDNLNGAGAYVVRTNAFPVGVAEGLGTFVTLDGSTNTVIEKIPVFVSSTIATRDSISSIYRPTFSRAVTVVNNFKRGSGKIYYTGTNIPQIALKIGGKTVAKKKSGLTRIFLFPSGIRGRIARGYFYGEVLRQRCKVKDKEIVGDGLGVAIHLWGMDLVNFPIPQCTRRCGGEERSL